MTKVSVKMRNVVQKLGHLQVVSLITIVAVIFAELFAYFIADFFSFSYPIPSSLIVTLLATGILTPFISWPLVKLLYSLDELEQKMNYLATYDPMTKLLSRQAFFKRSLSIHDMFANSKKSYTVAIIDMDDFKLINDTHGHEYGDKVLIDFGKVILNIFEPKNIIGRIGGEEFALFFTVDKYTMKQEMDKIHQSLLNSKIPHNDSYIMYTISIGIFENKTPNKITLDEALSFADNALYKAKVTGKNKSIIYSDTLLNDNAARRSSNFRSKRS